MAEQAPSELLGQMLGAARVERIGHQAGIVDRVERDAVARERHHVELRVLHDLEHARVLENRLQQVQRLAHRNLRNGVAGKIEPVGRTVGKRHVGRMSRHDRERHADQLAPHRIGGIELYPEGEMPLIARGLQQIGEPRCRGHRLVIGTVEGDGFELAGTLDRELRRGVAGDRLARWRCLAARRAAQRMIVIVFLLALRRCRRRHAFRQRRAEPFGHAAKQRGEFELAHKAGQGVGVGLAHRGLGKRHLERHVRIEDDEGLGQSRLVGELNQVLAPLVLLDLRGAREQRFEIAELVDEERRGLDPDAGDARHVIGRIADQRLHLDHLGRRHAEALDHLGLADRLVLHRVVHDHAGLDDLHQVLVGRHDGHFGAGFERLARIGRDQIVGLVAFHLDAGHVEGAHGIAYQRELRDEVTRRLRPVGLVAVEQIAPEGLGRIVENHRDMGGRGELSRLAQELPQHGAEAMHRADRQPVGGPRQRGKRVIGAEDVARSVDQIDVVALCHRPAGGAVALCCCHDAENIGIGRPPRESLPNVIHHSASFRRKPKASKATRSQPLDPGLRRDDGA